MAEIESYSDVRIGVFAVSTGNNILIQYRADEPFPFESTFKIIGVAAILQQSMKNSHYLQQKLNYTKQDLVYWSPVTEKHLADGMTISDLCEAAITFSDNTAINLLIKKLGGPDVVTAFARSIGDNAFRLNNWEPELNSNPNDLRDTSTPASMGKTLRELALGSTLASTQREQLVNWLKANTTGNSRIRAGIPKGWMIGDKTGTARSYGITNDIAIIWPPGAPPIIMAIYLSTQNKNDTKKHDDIIAQVSRILSNTLNIAPLSAHVT